MEFYPVIRSEIEFYPFIRKKRCGSNGLRSLCNQWNWLRKTYSHSLVYANSAICLWTDHLNHVMDLEDPDRYNKLLECVKWQKIVPIQVGAFVHRLLLHCIVPGDWAPCGLILYPALHVTVYCIPAVPSFFGTTTAFATTWSWPCAPHFSGAKWINERCKSVLEY